MAGPASSCSHSAARGCGVPPHAGLDWWRAARAWTRRSPRVDAGGPSSCSDGVLYLDRARRRKPRPPTLRRARS
eukprot:scaffold5880_cov188-Prasinococcus_capsulatus_cf.AAC.1